MLLVDISVGCWSRDKHIIVEGMRAVVVVVVVVIIWIMIITIM
jgi:hypothetical protein